jgi:hypothetical protein
MCVIICFFTEVFHYNVRRKKNMKRAWFVAVMLCWVSLFCLADVPVNEITRQKVLSNEEWQASYDSYKADPVKIETLKSKLGPDLHIDIYLGLWCSDSKNNVPAFIRMLDIAGSSVSVRFYNVQRKPVKTIKYFSDKYRIEKVPTFIFYRGDIEAGRIIENPTVSLIDDSIAMLSK